MGGTTTTNNTTSNKTDPWAPAIPALTSLLGGVQGLAGNTGLSGAQSGALNQLSANAQQGNPYAGGIQGYANSMLAGGGAQNQAGMVNDAWNKYQGQMGQTANGDYMDPNKNPWFSQVTNTIGNDVQNRLAGLYAGAGRDPAGAGNFGGWLGRGIAEGTAPIFAQAYGQERQNQLGAQNNLLQGAGQTSGLLGGMQNQFNQNQGQGVGAAGAALGAQNYGPEQQLAIEAQRRGIPVSMLAQLAGIAGPLAGLGGTSSGTQNSTQQMSGAGQFATIMGGIGSLGNLWNKK